MSKAIDISAIIEVAQDAARLKEELAHSRQNFKTFEFEGVTYQVGEDGGLGKMPEWHYDTLTSATLEGIVDYLTSSPDNVTPYNMFIHIISPWEVRLFGPAQGLMKKRELFARATAKDRSGLPDKSGQFYTQEAFAVWLLTSFADAADLGYVRNVAGKLKAEKVAESTDTGFAQVVATKNGVESGFAEVKNPVVLAPYRSFPEIAPIEQAFLVRLKSDEDGKPPVIALFDADNGGWAVEAVARIKQWLADKLPETTIIG